MLHYISTYIIFNILFFYIYFVKSSTISSINRNYNSNSLRTLLYYPHLLSTITKKKKFTIYIKILKLKYQIRPVSLFTTQTRRTPSNFVSRAFKSNSIPNCFASQYKIQARSSVNFEELWNPRLTRRDS